MNPTACSEEQIPGCREQWIETEPGVTLRVLEWRPETCSRPELLLVPGWVSGIESWIDVLAAASPERRIVYVESREKPTARLGQRRLRPGEFGLATCGRDLAHVAREYGLEPQRTVAFGSSMGATAILEGMKHDKLKVAGAFLIGPNARFRIPWWGRPLLHLPSPLYTPARHFAVWYIERFRVDGRREPEQMARYRKAIMTAEPRRLKLSARAVASYSLWPDLNTVRRPVAIAWAPSDTLHHEGDILRLLEELPQSRAVRCSSNRFMHTSQILTHLERFEDELQAFD